MRCEIEGNCAPVILDNFGQRQKCSVSWDSDDGVFYAEVAGVVGCGVHTVDLCWHLPTPYPTYMQGTRQVLYNVARCDASYVLLPLPFIESMHCTRSRLHPRADQPMHRNEAAPLSKTSSSTVLLCCCCQTLCRVVRCIIEVTRCNCRLANDWKQGRDRKSGGNQIGSFNLPNNHV